MIYTELTCRAMKIAYQAHHMQTDKAGIPYIFHPIHLAEQMEDEISCCAALLHDVAEDTDITLEDLSAEFPPAVIDILRLLTHRDGVPYFDYVQELKSNPTAVKVKLADLTHNSDISRCIGTQQPTEKTAERLEKYNKAKAILLED